MTILYDADHLGTLRYVMRIRHTMLLLVGKSPAFWLLMSFHATLLVMDRRSHYSIPFLDKHAASTLTSLLTFFLVFYGSNAFSRLGMFYEHCVGLGGSVLEWAALINLYLPPQPRLRCNVMR